MANIERAANIVAECSDRVRVSKSGPGDFAAFSGWAEVWDVLPAEARDQVRVINDLSYEMGELKIKYRAQYRTQIADALLRLSIWLRGYAAGAASQG